MAEWIKDQQWFLPTWHRDPTIAAALVMIDALDHRFLGIDFSTAWQRLTDESRPAISFHLLPLNDNGQSADLYVKMNSRGKPLTPFENFKAWFERKLELAKSSRADEFSRKIDGVWSDAFWSYRDSEYLIDYALSRYFHFDTDLCFWRCRMTDEASTDFEDRAGAVFCEEHASSPMNLAFLFQAFDAWTKTDAGLFGSVLNMPEKSSGSNGSDKVTIFSFPRNSNDGPDLMRACCRLYGDRIGDNRSFSFANTLLLYAFLLRLSHDTPDFTNRIRVLRNLIEASGSEIRNEWMPGLLDDVETLIRYGELPEKPTFNKAAVEDERIKSAFLNANPELAPTLCELENHQLLRGGLVAFELDHVRFAPRAKAFCLAFSDPGLRLALTGALLAHGDYSRSRERDHRRRFFGTSSRLDDPWRQVLSGGARGEIGTTRAALASFLDDFDRRVALGETPQMALEKIQSDWLAAHPATAGADWRWAMVKYPAMRAGESGIYGLDSPPMGYTLCMLDKTQFNSWYRDPFLSAILSVSNIAEDLCEPRPLRFTGYPDQPRKLRLRRSGTLIECVQDGFKLTAPQDADNLVLFEQIAALHGVIAFSYDNGATHAWISPKLERNGVALDASDRVEAGARLLRGLVDGGL